MELAIAVAVPCAVVLVALLRGGGDPSRSIVDMWGFRPLGWPSGVQEDDDLHWSWMAEADRPASDPETIDAAIDTALVRGGATNPDPRAAVDGRTGRDPEVIDLDASAGLAGGSLRVERQRVTYVVRSADRARS